MTKENLNPIIHDVHFKGNRKAVAFTFDDGPNPVYTPQVLEIFRKAGGKATFYMIGEHMVQHPELVKQVMEEGHEFGNHTYTHPFLTKSESSTIHREEIDKAHLTISEMTGRAPTTFRPPYLDYNEETVAIITEQFNYTMIGAVNMEATDWEMPGVDHIITKTRKSLKNGAILLFHDGFDDRSQTIEAVKILVTELKKEGYDLVTVSEILEIAAE